MGALKIKKVYVKPCACGSRPGLWGNIREFYALCLNCEILKGGEAKP